MIFLQFYVSLCQWVPNLVRSLPWITGDKSLVDEGKPTRKEMATQRIFGALLFLIKPPLVGHSGDFSKLALEQKEQVMENILWFPQQLGNRTNWQMVKLWWILWMCAVKKGRLKEATRCEQEPKKVPGAWWCCNHVIYVQISWETPVKIQFHYVPNALPDTDENGCCWLPDSDFCPPGNPRMQ